MEALQAKNLSNKPDNGEKLTKFLFSAFCDMEKVEEFFIGIKPKSIN